jgi:hypothetical protein
MQFEGEAAQWMASVQHKFVRASWQEFCAAVLHRFGKNLHQSLVRRLYRLRQTGTIVAYISAFSVLMDQLNAYEPNPDMLHYTTRFIDGLKYYVRMIVAVQRPSDLDTAYSIALVQEEVADDDQDTLSVQWQRPVSSHSSRHSRHSSIKTFDDPRSPEATKTPSSSEDKLTTLKAYRKAKGLCFICGKKWGKEHKCGTTVQLHVVQEMLEFCANEDSSHSAMWGI